MIAVPSAGVLHLTPAGISLPDGTFLLRRGPVPAGLFLALRPLAEEGGGQVTLPGSDRVLSALGRCISMRELE